MTPETPSTHHAEPGPTPDRRQPLSIDDSLRIIIQRLQDLAHRVDFLESALLPGTSAPSVAETARAHSARADADSLGSELESIENALGSVMTSIEDSRAVPTPPPVEPVVDLSEARHSSSKADVHRQSGWQPVATRRSG